MIMVIVVKDMKQVHRHGLGRLALFSILLIIMYSILFSFANDQFEMRGMPSWTGSILEGDGPGGVEMMTLELEADTHIGFAPLTVNYTARVEHAQGDIEWKWYVGEDGEPVSTSPSPLRRTFDSPETHSVRVVVEDGRGSRAESEWVYVQVIEDGNEHVQAIMLANRTEGPDPLDVQFEVHAASGFPPYNYTWDFGDGVTSTEQAPVHTFSGDGEEYQVRVEVTDASNNTTGQMETMVKVGEEGGDELPLPFTLLDMLYGFAVIATLLLVPVSFVAAYGHEVKRGTVRTLVCYPMGPIDITMAKLIYAGIIGFIFSFIVFTIPSTGLDKPAGEKMLIFFTAFTLTYMTLVIGALSATALARVVGKMWFRPYTLGVMAVWLAFLFTETIMGGVGWFLGIFSNMDPDFLVNVFAPLIEISPYHLGGVALSMALGGPGDLNPLVFAVPVLMLVGFGYLSARLFPSVFEKE